MYYRNGILFRKFILMGYVIYYMSDNKNQNYHVQSNLLVIVIEGRTSRFDHINLVIKDTSGIQSTVKSVKLPNSMLSNYLHPSLTGHWVWFY